MFEYPEVQDLGFTVEISDTYLWLVGNGGMVVKVVIIVPHSSIPLLTKGKDGVSALYRLLHKTSTWLVGSPDGSTRVSRC